MTITEILEDLELHVIKYGGEAVTEKASTRDLLAALRTVALKPARSPEPVAWRWRRDEEMGWILFKSVQDLPNQGEVQMLGVITHTHPGAGTE